LDFWNAPASTAACELGALAGRKSALLLLVTLANDGRNCTAATVPASHTTTTRPPEPDREPADRGEHRAYSAGPVAVLVAGIHRRPLVGRAHARISLGRHV